MTRGRPRRYESASELAERVNAYFDERAGDKRPPTIAGLCVFLKRGERHALAEYEAYGEDFSATVKNARLRIEEDRSERLLGKDTFTPGVIFDLKNNHGWKDQTQQEVTGKVSVTTIQLVGGDGV